MGLSACNLLEKLAVLIEVEGGKYHIVYFSAESALDKRFLQSLKKDTVFSRRMVACVYGFEVSNIYAMDIQRGLEVKSIHI